jgi:hypothetical protein
LRCVITAKAIRHHNGLRRTARGGLDAFALDVINDCL